MQQKQHSNTKINFGSASFKKYFANTGWMFGEKVMRLFLAALVGIMVARYLGPEKFGLLNYAISFVGLFSTIAVLGLDGIVTRELVKTPEKKDVLLGTSFMLRVVGAFVSFILLILGLLITQDTSFTVILILIIASSSFFQSLGVIEYFFQSRVEAKYTVWVQFCTVAVTSLIKLALIYLKASLIYFASVAALEFVFLAAGFIIIYKSRAYKLFDWKFSKYIAKELLLDSWPLILSGMVVSIYMKVDQVLIKKMMTDKDVGYYAAAVRLSEAWYFIPTAIANSLFPAIINAKSNPALYKARLQKLYDLLTWIAIGIAVPVTIFADQIVLVLLGKDFLPASGVLAIYIWAGVAVFLGVASSKFLINENLTKISFYRTALGMIVNIILNIWLIPIYGIIGSALATLISYTIAVFSIGFSAQTEGQFGMMLKSVLFINLIKRILGTKK